MKKEDVCSRTRSLVGGCMTALIAAGVTLIALGDATVPPEANGSGRALKVLMIGNSFSGSAWKEMPPVAKAMGCRLDLLSMAIGGATMDLQVKNLELPVDATNAPYFVRFSWASCPFAESAVQKVLKRDRGAIRPVITAEKWDIVTIQQASPLSAFYARWQPAADRLVALVRELAPQAEIRLQETWSWSPYNEYMGKWKLTPATMYERIHSAYGIFARKHGFRVIPTGAAVDIYRRDLPVVYEHVSTPEEVKAMKAPELPKFYDDVVGQASWNNGRVKIDNIHLNATGQYLQGCVWVAALFGVDVTKCTYRPDFLSEEKAAFLRRCAMAAINGREPPVEAGFGLIDAAKEGDEAERIVSGGETKGVKLTVTGKRGEGEGLRKNKHFTVRLEGMEKRDRALTLVFSMRLPMGTTYYEKGPRDRVETSPGMKTLGGGVAGRYDVGAGGLNRWPFGAVTVDGRGYALAIDFEKPAYFRTTFDPSTRRFAIHFDVGLAPEKNTAEFGFRFFAYEDDFRGAIIRHAELEPWAYENRLKKHGLWLDFTPMMNIPGYEDFGIQFMESPHGDRNWYDERGIYTYCYNEPSTWWMKIKSKDGTNKVTMAECLAMAEELAKKGNKDALAWKNSGMLDEEGRPAGKILSMNWCDGIAWSCSPLPGWKVPCDYWNKNPEKSFVNRYAKPFPKGSAGEYLDSIEAGYTMDMDFNRRAFLVCDTPLCFSHRSRLPGIFKGLSIYEYTRHVAKRVWPLGRTTMGNYTPEYWPWLSAYIDVCGKETAWITKGKYLPQCHRDLIELRARSMGKPYCLLMGVNYHEFDHECVKKYILRCLAYGMYPGVSWGYFTKPEKFFERDRDLFKRYMPLCRKVGEAGWRPRCTLVKTSDARVYAEQFGDNLVTLCNSHEQKPISVKLTAKPGSVAAELVNGGEISFANGEAEIELGPDEVRVLEFAKEPLRTPFTPCRPVTAAGSAEGACDVVFLGDDAVADWATTGAAVWKREFAEGPRRALNLGVRGDCTEHLLWRLENGLLGSLKPKAVVLAIGAANFAKRPFVDEPVTDTLLGIQAIVGWLRKNQPQARVILGAVLPGPERVDSQERVRVAHLNRYLSCEEMAQYTQGKKRQKGLVCDFSDRLLDAKGALDTSLCRDSLTLRAAGYEIWAESLRTFLDLALGRTDTVPPLPEFKRLFLALKSARCLPAKPALARYWFEAGHNRFLEKRLEQYRNRDRKYDAVWLGDSVSHYWEYPKYRNVFREYFGGYEIFNNCFGGDETQNTIWNLELGGALDHLETKVVQLLIGENNVWWTKPRELQLAVGECLRLIREKQPKAKILLLSMLPREVAHKRGDRDFRRPNKNSGEIMDIIVSSNALLKELAAKEGIEYVDMLPSFMDRDNLPDIALLPDGTHPNEAGYHVWGKLVSPVYRRLLGR